VERGDNLPIVPAVQFGKPPWFVAPKDFLDTLVSWKTT
jgi:hypothetical protein